MNLALWIATGLLAMVALTGGLTKTIVPRRKLATLHGAGWTGQVGDGFVKGLGGLEVLAAAGLVLPVALGIAPVLLSVTALCWILLMVGAMITHGRRGERALVAVNVVYLAIAAFLVLGTSGAESFLR